MTQPYITPPDDEIDLGELLSHIWDTKWRVLFAVLTVTLGYFALLAWQVFNTVNHRNYSLAFELPFVAEHGAQLPNGSPFELSSIISSTVLNRVHQNQQLDDLAISRSAFRRSVRIEPYNPNAFLIRAQYQQLLNDRNLSTERQNQLQQELNQALAIEALGGFRLRLDVPDDMALSEVLIERILHDIPYTWALREIEERGVLDIPLATVSERMFDPERMVTLDYLIAIDLLRANITLMASSVDRLMQVPGANGLRDIDTNFSLQDLQKVIQDLERYDLRQLRSPVQELGLTRDSRRVEAFFARQLQDLALMESTAINRARVTRDVLNSYQGDDVSRNNQVGSAEAQLGALSSPQLGDAFLDRLIELTRQGGGIEFRQNLVQDILLHRLTALDYKRQQHEIVLTTTALSNAGQNASPLRDTFAAQLEHRLPDLLVILRGYTRIIERMHTQLVPEPSTVISTLVMSRGDSFAVHTPNLVTDRAGLILAVLVVLTAMVTVFVSLSADFMRRRRLAHMESE